MKTLLLLAVLMFVGCAALQQAESDAIACLRDPVCSEMAQGRADLYGKVAGTFNPAAGAGVGAVALALGLFVGGRRKRRE